MNDSDVCVPVTLDNRCGSSTASSGHENFVATIVHINVNTDQNLTVTFITYSGIHARRIMAPLRANEVLLSISSVSLTKPKVLRSSLGTERLPV